MQLSSYMSYMLGSEEEYQLVLHAKMSLQKDVFYLVVTVSMGWCQDESTLPEGLSNLFSHALNVLLLDNHGKE